MEHLRWELPASLFNERYIPYAKAQQRFQLFYGGAGSGKSAFVAMRCVLDALEGRNTLVIRQVAATLNGSCCNEVMKAVERLKLGRHFVTVKTERSISCLLSGAQILFRGLDDAEKIKSLTPMKGVLTDIWVEEATETDVLSIKQLEKRLRGESPHAKRLTFTFNPVSRNSWLYERFFEGFDENKGLLVTPELLILRTTYLDNRFLTGEDGEALRREEDPYFRSVYTLGQWGRQEEGILTHWQAEDLSLLAPRADCLRFGLDFGFSAHPSALIKLHYAPEQKTIYVLDELYERGLHNAALAEKVKALAGNHPVICDSAEPRSIEELRRHGVRAHAARKGPDSVLHGIQWLNQHRLVVDLHCRNTLRELAAWRWQRDARGECLNVPQKGEDHLMDALRYALEGDRIERKAVFW